MEKIETKENNNIIKQTRNYGIDALRILAMFFIVCYHIIGQGGIKESLEFGTIKFNVINLINALLLCAVNCYGLISGYVGVNKKVKYSNLAYLWLQVFFYCICVYVFLNYILKADVPILSLRYFFTPVLTEHYWYFTAYFIMFLFTPFLNKLLDLLDKKSLRCLCITLFGISVMSLFTNQIYLNSGFSWTWLSILYLFGGIVKKLDYGKNIKSKLCLFGILICILLGFFSKIIGYVCNNKDLEDGLYVRYTSPIILCMALFFFIMFKNTKFKNRMVIKIIEFISPLTFGIYIIHENRLVIAYYLYKKFVYAINLSTWQLVLTILFSGLAFFTICAMLEFLRLKLFNLLKVKENLLKIEDKIKFKVKSKYKIDCI